MTANLTQIWYNRGDKPVRWAKWLAKIIPESWFQARPWGEMGRVGYKGQSLNVISYDAGDSRRPMYARGHSDIFKGENEAYFMPLIAELAIQGI
jgi:hypothetical protein